jgi:TetR/AcrR family transcriptional regulator
MPKQSSNPVAERSNETRTRILDAALTEFSANGLAGARTERIAEAAGVNKALLYYYFESKEKLYLETLEMIAGRVRETSMAVFLMAATPGERIVRTALNHFDRILAQQEFQSLMQQEMMRLHRGESGALPVLVKRAFEPLHTMFETLMREGIAAGELVEVDTLQVVFTSMGANVFYFLSAPVWRMIVPFDPFSAEAIAARRKAVVEYLGQALFQDRQHGAAVAARVFADTPMPVIPDKRMHFGRKV